MNDATLANELYTAYCESVGGVDWQGNPLPNWEEFSKDEKKQKQVLGWIAVANRAIAILDV